jgi:TldD protein
MNESLTHYALDIARSEYAEARIEELHGVQIIIKNGNLDGFELLSNAGLSVRVLHKGGLGFASTNLLTREGVRDVVQKAEALSRSSASRNTYPIGLSEETMHTDSYSIPQKKKLADSDRAGDLIEACNHVASQSDIGLQSQIFEYEDEVRSKYYVNSEGAQIRSVIPRIDLFAVLTIVEGAQSEQCHLQYGGTGGWETFDDFNLYDELSREARVVSRMLQEGKKAPQSPLSLIVGSEVVGIVCHESCGHPFEADRILGREAAQAGESFVKPDMAGYTIGTDLVNVAEDPTMEGSYGYYLYDDEGVKAGNRMLIQEGKIHEFLHNRETAFQLKGHSNGSARAIGYNREPIVRMSNTYFCPGDYSREELIEETAQGILMESFTEWNIDDKRFNQRYIGREAYLVEKGEITTPVIRPVLEITTTGFYSSVEAVGDEIMLHAGTCGKGDPPQGAPASMGGPYVKLKDIRLGGTHA